MIFFETTWKQSVRPLSFIASFTLIRCHLMQKKELLRHCDMETKAATEYLMEKVI